MAEVSIKDLTNKRGVIKGTLTRLINFVQSLAKEVDDELINNIQMRLDKSESIWEQFNSVQSQIEMLETSTDNELERDSFETNYFSVVGKMKSLLKAQQSKDNACSSETRSSISASSNNSNSMNSVKLPTINLPTFDGQYGNFPEFKEAFKALVDNNESLSDIQKFIYLRSALERDALQVVKSIEVTSANYSVAWKILVDRFENKKLMIHNHIKAIFDHPNINKESYVELRNLFDSVNKHLRALKTLGEDVDGWDRLIIFVMSNKFDSVTRRDWESHKYEGELPTVKDVEAFLKLKCEILEKLEVTTNISVDMANKGNFNKNGKYNNKKQFSSAMAATSTNRQNYKCYFCSKSHSIFKCEEFLELSPSDRVSAVKKLKLCLNCLRPSHPSWKCHLAKCLKCRKSHNTILHYENLSDASTSRRQNATQVESAEAAHTARESVTHAMSSISSKQLDVHALTATCSQVLLSTAIIKIKSSDNKWITCRALLDSASQSHFITKNLCDKLGLPKLKTNHSVTGVGQLLTHIYGKTDVSIRSCYNSNFAMDISCLILPRITDSLPSISFNKNILNIDNVQLADPNYNVASDIDILLGASAFWSILCSGQERVGTNNGLILQKTQLGWVVAGELHGPSKGNKASIRCFITNTAPRSVIDDSLEKFWVIEEVNNKNLNVRSNLSEAEKHCELHFKQTTVRDSSGRFSVSIPFKNTINNLGQSYETALRRFEFLERKLMKNEQLRLEYCTFMNEYIDLKHMSEIADLESFDYTDGYFMPHHAVIKSESLTTKCRVVFDCSAKTSSGLSLNDVQYIGPTLQQDVFSILTRFRQYKYVMTSDVSKMYRQILITEQQRKYHRILWRAEPTERVKIYELNRVTYGNASSPYLAVRCLFQLADENRNAFPETCDVIKRDFYMDDLLTGTNSGEELLKLQAEITKIMASAGFDLRKWLCNDKEVLNKFQVNNALQVGVLEIGENEQNKTLGVYWNSNKDLIQYKLKVQKNGHNKITKRIILSVTCQIFDPLGLLGPIIIVAKLIMQELWKLKLEWDDAVPFELASKWQKLQDDISDIPKLEIPRQVVLSEYVEIELHGFCDASEMAYGACIFIRCIAPCGEIKTNLLCAKSRVAPIKQVSLPRLELCGALLLANLATKVATSLNITFNGCYFWTDSMITLAWIRGAPNKWKTFVANRVGEIQTLTDMNEWHHVGSQDNPADLLSRGASTITIRESSLWWHGPAWLKCDSGSWLFRANTEINKDIPEQKSVSCATTNSNECNLLKTLINKYSSLTKLQRIVAYIVRFVTNIRLKNKKPRQCGALTPRELENSLHVLIEQTQVEHFPREYFNLKSKKPLNSKSKILALNPFLCEGLLRVGGRLRNSLQEYDKKYPIILPRNSKLTELILRNEHYRLLHCGVQALLCSIRDKYWPIAGRNACKKIIKSCVVCFKANPRECTYLMGDLPDVRVNSYSPFSNVGVDYGGPFVIKDRKTRGAKLLKSYICLFVCMCTRAVHIELVSELTTQAFLAALTRFVSRRGKPSNIFSDNGGNFVGANNELSKMSEFLENNNELIKTHLSTDRIKWNFIPARSPNFGGIWEAGIKSTKYHIKRLVSHPLAYEDFNTLLIQIEGVLNSRPLCPLSQDPNDLVALTPAHFLIGKQLTALPEISITDVPENRLNRWQRVQALAQHYWTRWSKEYLSELQTRVKWKKNSEDLLKIGSLVLIKDSTPSMVWQLGRVSELRPGKDGVVRVVNIKVANGELTRAVNKICVLPIEC